MTTKNRNQFRLTVHLIPISNTVSAGELLRAVIIIQQPRQHYIESILLNFYGILEFYDDFEQLQVRKIAEATRYLSPNDLLSSQNANEKQISTSLLIPTNAPTIFDSGAVHALLKTVSYYAEVQVMAEGSLYTDRKQLFVQRSKSIFTQMPKNSVSYSSSIAVNNLVNPSGKIVATICIPTQNVNIGQVLPCSICILNCFRRIKVDLRLVEKILRIDDRPPQSHMFTEFYVISKRIASLKQEDKAWMSEIVDIWIPDEPWRFNIPGTTSLGVYLQMKLHISMKSSLLVECPIFIRVPEKNKSSLIS